MESTTEIEWLGDAKERLIERAKVREDWGDYQGISNLGKRLIQEVTEKISKISKNLNLLSERNDEERVAPLESGFVFIYKVFSRKVDLYLLIENEKLDLELLKESLEATFKPRKTHELPKKLEAPPESWRRPYEGFNLSHGIDDSFKRIQEFFLKIHLK